MNETVLQRFLRYVAIDTQSDLASVDYPSTQGQLRLLSMLKQELLSLGVVDVRQDQYGYVTAYIPSNVVSEELLPAIGFIAHVDTSPDLSGKGVLPQLIHYQGGDIIINASQEVVLRYNENPWLDRYRNHTLVFSDGTTLLGADDKAGVAEIMSAVAYVMQNPSFLHGDFYIAFTPDEEVGRGVDFFDRASFGAQFAYTMDGGALGEIEYENFNAAFASIVVKGDNVHPGYAKGKMTHALRFAMEIDRAIPATQRAETTEHREGFYHLTHLRGDVQLCEMGYLIRDFSDENFIRKQQYLKEVVDGLMQRSGVHIELQIKEQYRNMLSVLENGNMHVVDRAVEAMCRLGITPSIRPIRGGTDGCRLSFMSLPCPNLFAGGELFHSRYEFVSCQTMEKAVSLILEIIKPSR